MIVITVIGLLAAISIPSFQKYVTKSRLAEVGIVYDAIKKAEITYKLENNQFGLGFFTLDGSGGYHDLVQAILNGEKIAAGSHVFSANAILQFPIAQDARIGAFINVDGGGYNDATNVAYGNSDGSSKLGTTSPVTGSSCNNSSYAELTPTDVIPDFGSLDTSADWFILAGMANISYPDSENCVWLIQYGLSQGEDPISISSIVELK
ncbi:MAG: hypothetical protein KDD46_06540 [Bdellovibrionales bacterium]|nr:hypothetical protein [Bdellovibrionales bacterium]